MENTIQALATVIEDLLTRDLQAIDWDTKPGPDKWSRKEIMGHLIDSAQINLQRFVRCTYQEGFKLVYDQVEWVAAQCYQDEDINEILELWRLLNFQIIRVWKNYPADRLTARCDNGKYEVTMHTVDWLAADYVEHMKNHLVNVY
ncbi:DinB family protein [Mucilaginibacter sp. dw_454]|uniref:DinB family protein n=1 Tax=Mucilaginibacter sp. dw_454 TaxID=2720079 RepID=UPI001BD5DBA7|nr:DinB family protein [Mucilaginibacter sp. dw_454]